MGYELASKGSQIIVGYEKGSLRFEGNQICFGRSYGGWIELGKSRDLES